MSDAVVRRHQLAGPTARRRAVAAIIVGAVVALVFVAVATSDQVRYATTHSSSVGSQTTSTPTPTRVTPVEVATTTVKQSDFAMPPFVTGLLRLLLFVGILTFVALVLRSLWRNAPRWRLRRRRPAVGHFEPLVDIVAALAADAEEQRAALRRGTPRNGIVECWIRLEAAVVDAGVAHDPSETSAEFTERVLVVRRVDPDAIARLAELYREARFSHHDVTEAARREAIVALDSVHRSLTVRGVGTSVIS